MSRDRFSGTPRVFLSYAGKDGEGFATRLRNRRQTGPDRNGWGCWLAEADREALDQVRFL
jgi:hypothetical protein